jgi:hypothetical protein
MVKMLRQNSVQLAVSHHRLTAHQRYLQRLQAIHQLDHPANQIIAALVAQLAQRYLAAEMVCPVGIAARAAQRAFTRDFDGKQWGVAEENFAP